MSNEIMMMVRLCWIDSVMMDSMDIVRIYMSLSFFFMTVELFGVFLYATTMLLYILYVCISKKIACSILTFVFTVEKNFRVYIF